MAFPGSDTVPSVGRAHSAAAASARVAPRRPIRYDPTRPRSDDAFTAARSHTSRVRRLKVVLPLLAVAGAGLFWATARFVPSDLATIAQNAGIDVTAQSIVMNRPRISGFEGTRRAYEVQAEKAVQSLSDPKVVTFQTIDASIGLDGAGTATLDATTGVYDGNRNTLKLTEGIAIATTTGYSASASEADIDLGQGSMVSSSPIEIKTGQGTIRANALTVSERGKRVAFTNGVSVTYLPPGELAAAPEARP
jgi:lipopolysaccharide export system protein LptC